MLLCNCSVLVQWKPHVRTGSMQAKLLAFGSHVRELYLFLGRSMQILSVGEFKVSLVLRGTGIWFL